jgi:chondroitin 4-sulfotransferase 11
MICNDHRFIYTKVGKTGSASIQEQLIKLGGNQQHLDHYHILDDINENTQNYFKFTFVRNPWARCVSRYFYVKSRQGERYNMYKNSTFNEYIKAKGPPYEDNDDRKFLLTFDWCSHSPNLQKLYEKKHPFENQVDWISDEHGKVLTDFVGKFENLQEDFNAVCDKIGIPHQQLPHKNKTNHKHYTEYYDDETRSIVAEKYAKDIEYFGYEFGE